MYACSLYCKLYHIISLALLITNKKPSIVKFLILSDVRYVDHSIVPAYANSEFEKFTCCSVQTLYNGIMYLHM